MHILKVEVLVVSIQLLAMAMSTMVTQEVQEAETEVNVNHIPHRAEGVMEQCIQVNVEAGALLGVMELGIQAELPLKQASVAELLGDGGKLMQEMELCL